MTSQFFNKQRKGEEVDVRKILDSDVFDHICQLVSCGCLISIGRSRDGGVMSLTVHFNGDRRTEWFKESDAAEEFLAEALAVVLPGGSQQQLGGMLRSAARHPSTAS